MKQMDEVTGRSEYCDHDLIKMKDEQRMIDAVVKIMKEDKVNRQLVFRFAIGLMKRTCE